MDPERCCAPSSPSKRLALGLINILSAVFVLGWAEVGAWHSSMSSTKVTSSMCTSYLFSAKTNQVKPPNLSAQHQLQNFCFHSTPKDSLPSSKYSELLTAIVMPLCVLLLP